jgi:hypothetical protein
MQYQFRFLDDLLITSFKGSLDMSSWKDAFAQIERVYRAEGYKKLLIDGSALTSFEISHAECQELAIDFLSYVGKGAFFSDDPLSFGMMRVVHSYSDNDDFRVFKTCRQAMSYLGPSAKTCSASLPDLN